jgi:hypothetical protein
VSLVVLSLACRKPWPWRWAVEIVFILSGVLVLHWVVDIAPRGRRLGMSTEMRRCRLSLEIIVVIADIRHATPAEVLLVIKALVSGRGSAVYPFFSERDVLPIC